MSTTRPLGPKGLPELAPTRQTAVTVPASEPQSGDEAPAHVADSVGRVQQTLIAGREHVARADAQLLAELKEAIKSGTFKVNVDELAERLIADAFGDDG
ncbi:MAG: hypothetical protein AMXMBFR64_34730 [Myxococcales bacterium]